MISSDLDSDGFFSALQQGGLPGFAVSQPSPTDRINLDSVELLQLTRFVERLSGHGRWPGIDYPLLVKWGDVYELYLRLVESPREGLSSASASHFMETVRRKGRWIDLTPYGQAHSTFAYHLMLENPDLFRWKFSSQIPNPTTFAETAFKGVLCALVVNRRGSSQPLGLVVVHSAHLSSGFASVSMALKISETLPAVSIDTFDTALNYIFTTWNFRKIYIHISEYAATQILDFKSIGLPAQEGRLRNHVYYDHRWHDLLILSAYRGESVENCLDKI